MRYAQRYRCTDRYCTAERVLPEHPTAGPRTVTAGCPACEARMTFAAVGRVAFGVGGDA